MSAGMCRFPPHPVKPACVNEVMAGRHRDGGLPPADCVY